MFEAVSFPTPRLLVFHVLQCTETAKRIMKEALPPVPNKPPPRRFTSPTTLNQNTSSQELKDKRRSGDYSQEITDKEELRLNKHIAASYKRLSLGSELSKYKEFGGTLEAKERRSLDWEMENSMFGSNLGKTTSELDGKDSGLPFGYNNQKFSTPNNYFKSFNEDLKEYEVGYNTPSPKGFSDFVQSEPKYGGIDGSEVRWNEKSSFNPEIMSAAKSHAFKESYMENDKVAVVDVDDDNNKELMDDIGLEVSTIKNRISSLKNLLETETSRFSPVPDKNSNIINNNKELASSLDTLESSEKFEDESKKVNRNYNTDIYRDSRLGSFERQESFGSQTSGSIMKNSRQNSFGSVQNSFMQPQPRHSSLGYQSAPVLQSAPALYAYQPNSHERQSSFGVPVPSPLPNHSRQSSLGLGDGNKSRRRPHGDSQSVDSIQGSRQSSFTNSVTVNGPYSTVGQHGLYVKPAYQTERITKPVNVNPKDSSNYDYPFKKPAPPASNVLEWKLSGSPFTSGLAKDDSVLLDQSRSDRQKDNLVLLESRPKSYAEGLKPPLTKLEKLELENKISYSMGALNLKDLDNTSRDFMDGRGIERPGYNREWDHIQRVLKQKGVCGFCCFFHYYYYFFVDLFINFVFELNVFVI